MGKPTGFLEIARATPARRPVSVRVRDWNEVYESFPQEGVKAQAARCMDCGVPFCHTGCPLNNLIPDWNDLVYRDRWREAIRALHATNNFPEFTGRICPAPCEASCVLGINSPAVAIKVVEQNIIDHAFRQGWIVPEPPEQRTGKRVAVIGSGPAGLAAAQQLNRAGHTVTIFEKEDRAGGLLRYGIPDFKLEKHHVDRRLEQMLAEGVEIRTGVNAGADVSVEELRSRFDATLLAIGAEQPRDLPVPGRELPGIHFAMEFLAEQNRLNAGDPLEGRISAEGKHVVIIGGGDTGADCLGTSHRQGARSVRQLELLPVPPAERSPLTPWPLWPLQLRRESSHEEGGDRDWSVATTSFSGEGRVQRLHGIRVGPAPRFEPESGTAFEIETDLVLLAMGFTGPARGPLLAQLGVNFDSRGNIAVDGRRMTSVEGVFAAGDARRGQSLVVWAIAEGRQAAEEIHRWLLPH